LIPNNRACRCRFNIEQTQIGDFQAKVLSTVGNTGGYHNNILLSSVVVGQTIIVLEDKMQFSARNVASTAAIAFVLFSGFAGEAVAGHWQVCNRTPDRLNLAIAYSNSFGQIVTEGWWEVGACGGCAIVIGRDLAGQLPDKSNAYLHADLVGNEVTVIRGTENFCVSKERFKINSSASPGCTMRQSFRSESINLNRDWTTNITGKGQSGNVCF
jgi:uncharacterized membrane protein